MATAFKTNIADPQVNHRGEFTQVAEILYSFATDTYYFDIPAGTLVTEVFSVVTEACDGSPTVTVGDGDDVDGYLTSAIIAPGTALSVTAPAVKHSYSATSATAYQFGKYYPTADTLDYVWTKGTSPTTGKIVTGYKGIRVDRFGVPAGLLNSAVL